MDKWLKEYQKYNHLCLFQEFLEYLICIPVNQYSDFMIKNDIPFKPEFNMSFKERNSIRDKVLRETYKVISEKYGN